MQNQHNQSSRASLPQPETGTQPQTLEAQDPNNIGVTQQARFLIRDAPMPPSEDVEMEENMHLQNHALPSTEDDEGSEILRDSPPPPAENSSQNEAEDSEMLETLEDMPPPAADGFELSEGELADELYEKFHFSGEPTGNDSPFLRVIAVELSGINATLKRLEVQTLPPKVQDDKGPANQEEDFADDEDEEPPAEKINDGLKSRDSNHTALHAAIREHTANLMGRKTKHAPLPDPPTPKEVDRLVAGQSVGPTIQDFKVDYLSPPTSPWNLLATEIFVDDFINTQWSDITSNKAKIKKAWLSHIASLKKKYKKGLRYNEDSDAEAEDRGTSARNRRRLNLYYRRLRACKRHPDLRRHVKALRQLGPSGMSSDESTAEGLPNSIYVICKKPWRADAVTLWLRDMDGVHLSLRVTDSGRTERGKWPHPRRDSTEVSERRAVRGLPDNFYNPQWLTGLHPGKLLMLNKQDSRYDLSHTDEIARIAYHWRGVTNASQVPKV